MHLTTVPAGHILDADADGSYDKAVRGADSGQKQMDLRGVVVLGVEGDVDLYTGPALRQALADLLPAPLEGSFGLEAGGEGTAAAVAAPGADLSIPARAVIVDLTRVEFIDSYAIGVFVQGHHLARRCGAAYALVATHPMIHNLFALTGLAKVLPLHRDVATAVAGLHPAEPSGAPADPSTGGR